MDAPSIIQLAEIPDAAILIFCKEVGAFLVDAECDGIGARPWDSHLLFVLLVRFSIERKSSF